MSWALPAISLHQVVELSLWAEKLSLLIAVSLSWELVVSSWALPVEYPSQGVELSPWAEELRLLPPLAGS